MRQDKETKNVVQEKETEAEKLKALNNKEPKMLIIENKSVIPDEENKDVAIEQMTLGIKSLGIDDDYETELIKPFKPRFITQHGYEMEVDGVVVPGDKPKVEETLKSRGPPGVPVQSQYYATAGQHSQGYGCQFSPGYGPAGNTAVGASNAPVSNIQNILKTGSGGLKRSQEDEPTSFIKGLRPADEPIHVVTNRQKQLSGGSVTRGNGTGRATVRQLIEKRDQQQQQEQSLRHQPHPYITGVAVQPPYNTPNNISEEQHDLQKVLGSLSCDDGGGDLFSLPSYDENDLMNIVKKSEMMTHGLEQAEAPAVTQAPAPAQSTESILRRKSDQSGPASPESGYQTCSSPESVHCESRPNSFEEGQQENVLEDILQNSPLRPEDEATLDLINEYIFDETKINPQQVQQQPQQQPQQQQTGTAHVPVCHTQPVAEYCAPQGQGQGQCQVMPQNNNTVNYPYPQAATVQQGTVGMQFPGQTAAPAVATTMAVTTSYITTPQAAPVVFLCPQQQPQRGKTGPRRILPKEPNTTTTTTTTDHKCPQDNKTPARPTPSSTPKKQAPPANTNVTPTRPVVAIAPKKEPVLRGESGITRPIPEILTDSKMKTRAHRQIVGLKLEELLKKDDDGDMWLNAYIMHLNENASVVYMIHAIISRLKREHQEGKIRIQDVINEQNSSYQTPVYLATVMNNQYVLDWLLKAGGNPNVMAISKTQVRKAAIHYAVSFGDQCLDVLWVLLECRDTDLNLKNTEGYSPLHVAILSHNKPIRDSLNTVNSTRVIEALIQKGADLDQGDGKSGKTPIQYLVETKDFNLIKSIFNVIPEKDLRQYLRRQTLGGNTALHIAAQSVMSNKDEHKKIIKLLVEKGADPSIKNFENQTASQVAYKPHKEDLTALLKSSHKQNHHSNGAHSPGASASKLPATVVPAAPSNIIYLQTVPTVQLMSGTNQQPQIVTNQQPQILTIPNNNSIQPHIATTLQAVTTMPQNTMATAPTTNFTIPCSNVTSYTLAQNANACNNRAIGQTQVFSQVPIDQKTPTIIPKQVPAAQNYRVAPLNHSANIMPLGSPQMAHSPPQVPSPDMSQANSEFVIPTNNLSQTNVQPASTIYMGQDPNLNHITRFLTDNLN